MRISSIFVLASRLKEDTEESKRHRKKADSDEDFEIILFWPKITRQSKKGIVLSAKDVNSRYSCAKMSQLANYYFRNSHSLK